jgi:hypothetical protein
MHHERIRCCCYWLHRLWMVLLFCLLMSRDYFAVAFVEQHRRRSSRATRQRQQHHQERSTAKPPRSPWSSPSAPRQSFSSQNHFKSILWASSSSLLDASSGEKILSASVEYQQLVADMAERPHLVTREACHTFFRTVLAKPSSSPWCANDDVAMVNQLFRAMQQLPHRYVDGRPTRETYELVQQVWLMSIPSASTQNPDTWLNHLQSLWDVYQTNTVDHSGDTDDDELSFLSQQEALWAPRRSTYLYTLKGLLQCARCDQKGTSSYSRLLDDTEALFDQMVHHAKTLPAVAPDILCANQVL